MSGVPAFILRRLYVKGSLHNREDGWGFLLKNTLGAGYARGLIPVAVDGKEIAKENSFFLENGKEILFSNVTEENTFGLQLNRDILLHFKAEQLQPGSHNVEVGFVVPGFGTLKFDFNDDVASNSELV